MVGLISGVDVTTVIVLKSMSSGIVVAISRKAAGVVVLGGKFELEVCCAFENPTGNLLSPVGAAPAGGGTCRVASRIFFCTSAASSASFFLLASCWAKTSAPLLGTSSRKKEESGRRRNFPAVSSVYPFSIRLKGCTGNGSGLIVGKSTSFDTARCEPSTLPDGGRFELCGERREGLRGRGQARERKKKEGKQRRGVARKRLKVTEEGRKKRSKDYLS